MDIVLTSVKNKGKKALWLEYGDSDIIGKLILSSLSHPNNHKSIDNSYKQ